MHTPSARLRIEDILAEIATATEILDERTFAELQDDKASRRAIERCIEIISEAARHLPAELTDRYPEVSWSNIRGIGNILRHEYGRVDDLLMWRVAAERLPELRLVIEKMLAEFPDA